MKESIFERMARWGAARGWNQSEIAANLGLSSPQQISNWKRRGVPPEWHAPIARLFGRSVDELMGLSAETPADDLLQKAWPFRSVDEAKVRNLDEIPLAQLEAAILIAAAQVGLDIKKT